MKRINLILNNKKYIKHIMKIKKFEQNRPFCGHDLEHLLNVARIAYIMNLEEELKIDKELIYATALLHDIGKWEQYKKNIPHHIASEQACEPILIDAGFDDNEIDCIKKAILYHREYVDGEEKTLIGLLYRADKSSRLCFLCDAEKECDWDQNLKVMELKN